MPINPQTVTQAQTTHKMLRMKQLIEKTGLSRSTLYDMMNVDSKRKDLSFPRGIKLTEATVCWLESEVDTWLESKINSRVTKRLDNDV
ncbi:MAG: AlpA family transcriptional regulator [Pseudomonadales bacterium]|nr:AlpA family transcriptional regulator [Pseudomonadales bacterium]